MSYTCAVFHFADQPERPLYVHRDGYPDGAADYLRTMLQGQAAVGASAFVLANDRATETAPKSGVSYRYWVDGLLIRAEKRRPAGLDDWQPLFTGELVGFINQTLLGSYLHALPLVPGAAVGYYTLKDLEKFLAAAQRNASLAEVGLYAPGPAQRSAAADLAYYQGLVRQALGSEIRAGRYPVPAETSPSSLPEVAQPASEEPNAVPLRLTPEQLTKLYPTVRCFERYDARHRADRQASTRMGHRQREATGEFFYVHPLVHNVAYPTAQAAREGGWRRYKELEKIALEKLSQQG